MRKAIRDILSEKHKAMYDRLKKEANVEVQILWTEEITDESRRRVKRIIEKLIEETTEKYRHKLKPDEPNGGN